VRCCTQGGEAVRHVLKVDTAERTSAREGPALRAGRRTNLNHNRGGGRNACSSGVRFGGWNGGSSGGGGGSGMEKDDMTDAFGRIIKLMARAFADEPRGRTGSSGGRGAM